jgi:hypothetical protein
MIDKRKSLNKSTMKRDTTNKNMKGNYKSIIVFLNHLMILKCRMQSSSRRIHKTLSISAILGIKSYWLNKS